MTLRYTHAAAFKAGIDLRDRRDEIVELSKGSNLTLAQKLAFKAAAKQVDEAAIALLDILE